MKKGDNDDREKRSGRRKRMEKRERRGWREDSGKKDQKNLYLYNIELLEMNKCPES